jgi:eukaryotic-like serine/threonine-protein kinase
MDGIDEPAAETETLDALDQPTQPDGEWAIPREYDVERHAETERLAHSVDAPPTPPPSPAPPAPPPPPPPRPGRTPSRGLAYALGAVAALVLAAGLVAWLAIDGPPGSEPSAAHAAATHPASKTTPAQATTTTAPRPVSTAPARLSVPDVRGMSSERARATLEKAGLRVRFQRVHSNRAVDTLLRELPRAGQSVGRAARVTLFVSAGPALIPVPDVVGILAADAVRRLRESGLVAHVSLVGSSRPAGTVLSQDPAARTHVRAHTAVRVRVAKAAKKPAPVVVPDVVGLDVGTAKAQLRRLGLRWNVETATSSQPPGTVLDQSPAGGVSTRAKSAVTLTVSTGARSVSVPDVTGLDEASARQQLAAAGFQVQVTYDDTADPSQDDMVLDQSPGSGDSAASGSTVLLTVGRSS